MKLFIISSILTFLIIGSIYFFIHSNDAINKPVNWNLELTTPKNYKVKDIELSYFYNGKELKRSSSMSNDGWIGSVYGSVLHNKQKEFLPDTIKLKWTETNSKNTYSIDLPFPIEQTVEYWNLNHELLVKQWGAKYPKNQLALKLGFGQNGKVSLWYSDYDFNSSTFALELASYKANLNNNVSKKCLELKHKRFAESDFSIKNQADRKITSLDIEYDNGELNHIWKNKTNNSILKSVNSKRGWGIAKNIIVTWFNKDQVGFKTTYEVAIKDLPKNINKDTHLIYLIDNINIDKSEWSKWENKIFIEVKKVKTITI